MGLAAHMHLRNYVYLTTNFAPKTHLKLPGRVGVPGILVRMHQPRLKAHRNPSNQIQHTETSSVLNIQTVNTQGRIGGTVPCITWT